MEDIVIEEKNGTVILGISGEIIMTTVGDIDDACRSFLNSDIKMLALDLRNVIFIDSFGISRMIKQSKAFTEKGIDFVLINLNDNLSQVFKIATFDKLFTIMTKDAFSSKYLQ